MSYSNEAVDGAKRIIADISLKALNRVKDYISGVALFQNGEPITLETAAGYLKTYFTSQLDSRIQYDTWQEIYNEDLLLLIHNEFSGKTE